MPTAPDIPPININLENTLTLPCIFTRSLTSAFIKGIAAPPVTPPANVPV